MTYYGLYNSETDSFFSGVYQYQFTRYADIVRVVKTRYWNENKEECDNTPYEEISRVKKYRNLNQATKAANVGYENYNFVPKVFSDDELELISTAKKIISKEDAKKKARRQVVKTKATNKIGYARVSSTDQNLDRQIKALQECSKVFSDKLSGKDTERPQLQEMLNYIRDGDIVVVTELDRLGRNNDDLTSIMNTIQKKGATLEALNLPTLKGIEEVNLRRLLNNIIIEVYKYQAESDRKRIKERQQEGIEIAKKKGKYKGKKPRFTENSPRLQQAFKLFLEGHTDSEVEELTGIPRRTFQRYRKKFNVKRLSKGEGNEKNQVYS